MFFVGLIWIVPLKRFDSLCETGRTCLVQAGRAFILEIPLGFLWLAPIFQFYLFAYALLSLN